MSILQKYFDIWNCLKQKIHKSKRTPYFKVGEIRWAQVGQNIGSEMFGKGERFQRPVIILQKVFSNAAIIIPLSSKIKIGSYYFNFADSKKNYQCALLTQIRYIDGKRFLGKVATIPYSDLKILHDKLIKLLKKNIPPA